MMTDRVSLSFLRSKTSRRRIAVWTGVVIALGLVYALLAPRWYRATVTVVPVKQAKGGGVASLLGGELGGLAAGFEASVGVAEPSRIAAVLESNAVTDEVIQKFDLRARYREKRLEDVRRQVWIHCSVQALNRPNLVKLSCEDKDPNFVREMLAYFVEFGNQTFRRVNTTSAAEEVRYLEDRVMKLRKDADAAAERMQTFQEENRIVDMDTQAKAVVSALAGLNTQRISKQLELDFARSFASGDEASLRQLRSQLDVVNERLRSLENPLPEPSLSPRKAGQSGAADSGIFPPALAVPELRANYERLYRDRRFTEASLVFALERLESARAAEARTVSTFQVLDPPTLPEKHARPKRSVIVLAAAVLGLLASLCLEWLRAGGNEVLRGMFGASPRPTPLRDESPGASSELQGTFPKR